MAGKKNVYEERSWSGNWRGKARKRKYSARDATYELITLLHKLGIKDGHYYDWEDDLDSYFNRVTWSRIDVKKLKP